MVNQNLVSKAYKANYTLTTNPHCCSSFTCALCQKRKRDTLSDPSPDFFISWNGDDNNWAEISIINAAKATSAFSRQSAVTIKDKGNAKKTYNGNSLSDPHDEVLKKAWSIFPMTKATVLIAIGAGGNEVEMVNDSDERNKHFDVRCNVKDGWTSEDRDPSRDTIDSYMTAINDFVKSYLEMAT